MRLIKNIIFTLLVMTAMLYSVSFSAFAAEAVYDDAGLFDDSGISAINNEASKLEALSGWDVYVVTTENTQGKSAAQYADDYYDSLYGAENGILYLIDMDNGNLYISTAGRAIDYMTDERIQSIFDEVIQLAYDGHYSECIVKQISLTESYYNIGIYADNQRNEALILTLAVAAVIGVIAALIGVGSVKKSYAFKTVDDVYEYTSKSKMNLRVNSDRLVNSFVTTRIIPKNINNGHGGRGGHGGGYSGGGRSSTHTSSAGRMHGGGGRSFR